MSVNILGLLIYLRNSNFGGFGAFDEDVLEGHWNFGAALRLEGFDEGLFLLVPVCDCDGQLAAFGPLIDNLGQVQIGRCGFREDEP
ncbi:MAG: hypothetical protein ACYSUV_15590 [Planctomycetota bacterium]|jgi:hypothetical protein